MNARFNTDDPQDKFWECMCLAAHETLSDAQKCCSLLVAPDFDRSPELLSTIKPLTDAGVEYLSRPHPQAFYSRRQQ